jgi:predicted amidophosphoribosyltransferase
MKITPAPFTCHKCAHEDTAILPVCPACGHPFARDVTQVHGRDKDPNGIDSGRFWVRAFFVFVLIGVGLSLLLLVWHPAVL